MALCRREGIANVLVTNGCVNPGPAAEILALADAANVDLKCFSAETYE
jgi:pyruvate formate lyase activating enzyme